MLLKYFNAIHQLRLCCVLGFVALIVAVYITICHNRLASDHFLLFHSATVLPEAAHITQHNSMQLNATHAIQDKASECTLTPRRPCCESDSKSCSIRFQAENFESWKSSQATRQNECENMAPRGPSLARQPQGWRFDHKIVKRAWVSRLPYFPRLSREVCLWQLRDILFICRINLHR